MIYKHKNSDIKIKVLNPVEKGRPHPGVFHCLIIESGLTENVGKNFDVSKDALGRDWLLDKPV